MSARHTRRDRHLMWTELGDLWEQVQGYLAMLALTLFVGGIATLFGLAIGEAAGKAPAWTFGGLAAVGLAALAVWRWRAAGRTLDTILREEELAAARARLARSLALVDAPAGYVEIWDPHVECIVCSQCGAPVTVDPCPVHGPAATDRAALDGGIPPVSVLARPITAADIRKWPRYFLDGPGRKLAEQTDCRHGYRLTDSCPCCDAEQEPAA
ncbi:hypothetical protein [Kibdelosporangium phytohabitans]|uniref:Uncharacterized protein n=1 Tax=Kibdelosporangium phytohabitans TaxID=860235 RepID=A0A0N9HVZ2_9PSEU|nr:hypothetical protein [Kibdelosporangium phytohabitans]ALG07642.1 hypothetical protein AOZ06_12645 [Kibdelosporangium phytohabitans]ALG07698.1 hypothetical protein AOZ06_12965 [Kibdelosporangium phytohabitans]MBE1471404.1 hypothetical protein [Kibdelosporangium phytohabitans]